LIVSPAGRAICGQKMPGAPLASQSKTGFVCRQMSWT
jgi:hypothetical protein